MAYDSVYKFAAALKESDDIDLPTSDADVLDLTKDEVKRQDAARKRNNVAMANFTMTLWPKKWLMDQSQSLIYVAQCATKRASQTRRLYYGV